MRRKLAGILLSLSHPYRCTSLTVVIVPSVRIQYIYSQVLYTAGDGGAPTGVREGAAGVADYTGFGDESDLDSIGSGVAGWSEIAGDALSRYAYAALYSNGLVGESITPGEKLTCRETKALMTAVATKLGIQSDEGVLGVLNDIADTDDLICNNNFVYHEISQEVTSPSDFGQMCSDFGDAVRQALNPPTDP